MSENQSSSAKAQTGTVENNSTPATPQKNIGMAILAYLIFFIPLLTDAKTDPFVRFHVRQGLGLFILFVVSGLIGVVPILGWIAAPLLWIIGVILLIIGIVNAAQGKEELLPLIGQYCNELKL